MAWLFEKLIFELDASSYSFKITCILSKQVISLKKMVVSSAKFTILISWSKGYLCYKTIIYQNVSSESQVKNFFISWKSFVPFSIYSSFCNFKHPMIYQIYDVMMSISTSDRVHFLIHLLNHNSLSHQTWQINTYKLGQELFWNLLNNLEDWG